MELPPKKNFNYEEQSKHSWITQKIHEEWRVSNKHTNVNSLQFHYKDLSIHFPIKVEDILGLNQYYTWTIFNNRFLLGDPKRGFFLCNKI